MGRCVGATTDCQGAIALDQVFFLVAAFQVCMRHHAGHASNQIDIIIHKKQFFIINTKKGALEFGHRSMATVAGSGFDFGADTLAGKSAEREIGRRPCETAGSCRSIAVRHDLWRRVAGGV